MKQSMIFIVMVFGFGLEMSSAETRNRPGTNFFEIQTQRIFTAFDRGRITYHDKIRLKNQLQNVWRFKRRALIDNRLSRSEVRSLNIMKSNFENNFITALNSRNIRRNNGCETRPPRRIYRSYRRR